MIYSVSLLPEAEADYESIYGYLFEHSESGAANWAGAFATGLDRLRHRPETCGVAEEPVARRRGLKQLLFSTKQGRTDRAIFKIDGEAVYVLRVLGPGQRPIRGRDLPRS